MTTERQFDEAVAECRTIFEAKFQEYGPSWRFIRASAICDRLFTKAARVRRLESLGGRGKITDSIECEFVGVANYSILFLDRLAHEGVEWPALNGQVAERWNGIEHARDSYNRIVAQAKSLLLDKNHDYDEAWRHIHLTTFTDEILVRTMRIRELLKSELPNVEAVEAQVVDILNYALLALIRYREEIRSG